MKKKEYVEPIIEVLEFNLAGDICTPTVSNDRQPGDNTVGWGF